MGKILTVKGISKNYKIGNTQVHALKSTTLDINKGEIVVVIGKSGSGKSTFLNILGGLIVPDSGEVLLDGKNLYKLGEKERAKIRNQKCGFIYQSFNLINELSVINNIRLPFDIAGKPYDTKRERELLAILDLEKRKHFYPSQLSGGERQRTAVARALLMEPSIILADEPTGNLDSKNSKEVINMLSSLSREDGKTLIVITHDEKIAAEADRIIRIEDGKIFSDTQTETTVS